MRDLATMGDIPALRGPTSTGRIDDLTSADLGESMSHHIEEVSGYADLAEVARGGDSVVYRARQSATGRRVALKVVLVDSPESRTRFAREVEITVALGSEHPHIVTVIDTATTSTGRPCLVMDFAADGSLDDRLRSAGPLPVAEVLRIGRQLADALAFAHERGVVHGDVKPQNVLVLPDAYVLTDFGIARFADSTHPDTERFSYRHASPQVLDGLSPEPADDIWSLGSTLHTLLDGRPPFASDDPGDDTALAYLRRARSGEPRSLGARAPEPVRQAIHACLAKRREDRYAAADVARALAELSTDDADPAVGTDSAAGSGSDPPGLSGPSGLSALSGLSEPSGQLGGSPSDSSPTAQLPAGSAAPRARRAAALVALGLGVGGALGWWGWSRLGPDSPPPAVATVGPRAGSGSASPVPSISGAAGTRTTDPAEPVTGLRSTITVAEVRDTAVYLEWTDPSGGQAYAVVVENPPGASARPVVALSPGVLSHTLPIAGPGQHCYTIVLRLGQQWGTSPQRCVGPTPS